MCSFAGPRDGNILAGVRDHGDTLEYCRRLALVERHDCSLPDYVQVEMVVKLFRHEPEMLILILHLIFIIFFINLKSFWKMKKTYCVQYLV